MTNHIEYSDSAIFADLLTGSGHAVDTTDAAKLLKSLGGIENLSHRTQTELANYPGIGPARARRIIAAIQLGKRIVASPPHQGPTLSQPAAVHDTCLDLAFDADESFWVIGVHSNNRLKGRWRIARGWESGVHLLPRQVFTLCLKEKLPRVILVHNHPSHDPTPSVPDITFTRKVLEGARILEIAVLDHVIIGGPSFHSMRQSRPDLEFAGS